MEDKINKMDLWLQKQSYFNSDLFKQTAKLLEESGELARALFKKDDELLKDSVGDIVVVLLTLCHYGGFTLDEALTSAYEDIKDREYGDEFKRLK